MWGKDVTNKKSFEFVINIYHQAQTKELSAYSRIRGNSERYTPFQCYRFSLSIKTMFHAALIQNYRDYVFKGSFTTLTGQFTSSEQVTIFLELTLD